MPIAYVLVLCYYSYSEYEIMRELSKLPYVVELNKVDRPYDIIVKLSADNMNAIEESIEKTSRIRGIESTVTLTAQE